MKTNYNVANVIKKITILADKLDKAGLIKQAEQIDRVITAVRRGEDFADLLMLFDEPLQLQVSEDSSAHTFKLPEEDEGMFDSGSDEVVVENKSKNRLDKIKLRHELLKLKEKLEEEDKEESDVEEVDATEPDVSEDVALETTFEDDEDDAENNLDDQLEAKLQEKPELLNKIVSFLENNPKLLEELLLILV